MKLLDFLFNCDTTELDVFLKQIGFHYKGAKDDIIIYNDKGLELKIFSRFDSIYIQDLRTQKEELLSHNFDIDSLLKGLKNYFIINKLGKTFELEKILLKADDRFFEKLQEKDFYVIDSGDTKIVLEHGTNKAEIIIYCNDKEVWVNFLNDKKQFFTHDKSAYWSLGTPENICLQDIYDIINRDDFLIFCQGIRIHEGSKNYTETQKKIKEICDEIAKLLIDKNKKYGNSALEPKNIFYKGNAENSILIRLDDKIGRIINNSGEIRTNDIVDIIGYLVLLLISKNINLEDIQKLKD